MTDQDRAVAELVSPEIIRELATPANFRYGQAIHQRGGVAFIEYQPAEVLAWVGGLDGSVAEGGSQRRRTRLYVTPKGLGWHCAGNPRNHQIFCKHCVALAFALLERSPKR